MHTVSFSFFFLFLVAAEYKYYRLIWFSVLFSLCLGLAFLLCVLPMYIFRHMAPLYVVQKWLSSNERGQLWRDSPCKQNNYMRL
jgi:hypothetical protein